MRKTTSIAILLFIALSTHVSAADGGALEASTIPMEQIVLVSQESTYGGSAAEPSSTAADTFDYSYLLVLTLGIAGLFWVRRQSQTL